MGKIRADERLRGRLLEDNFHLNQTEYYFSRGKPGFFFSNETKFVFVDGTLQLFFPVYMDKKIIFTLTELNVI